MNPPNVLYLHSHDTGRYVQPYGHAVPTPNIQRIAEKGVLFRQAFCAAPTCSPSRACLLTGQSAHSNGMLGLAHRGFRLNDYRKHIVHALRGAGYHSALAGVQHVAKNPTIIGYSEILGTALSKAVTPQERESYRSGGEWRELRSNKVEDVAPLAADFIRDDPPQPFFLSVGFGETHRKYPDPGPDDDRYLQPPAGMPDAPETRLDMAGLRASARILDRGVGTVVQAIDDAGLDDGTLVICTTDHGIAFPGMKCNLTDGGIGVMMIMRGPCGFLGGKVVDSLVSQIDLFPTICHLAGVQVPGWVEGRSMMPLVAGQVREINEQIFAEVNFHAAYEPVRGLRTREWKYVRRFGGRPTPVLANCDDGPTKRLLIRHGWRDKRLPSEGLYNLIFDPWETDNLVGDPTKGIILARLRDLLLEWMRATSDPLLSGTVQAPSGAVLNDPDDMSPSEPRHVVP